LISLDLQLLVFLVLFVVDVLSGLAARKFVSSWWIGQTEEALHELVDYLAEGLIKRVHEHLLDAYHAVNRILDHVVTLALVVWRIDHGEVPIQKLQLHVREVDHDLGICFQPVLAV